MKTTVEVMQELMEQFDIARAHRIEVLGDRFSETEFHAWFTSQVMQRRYVCPVCDDRVPELVDYSGDEMCEDCCGFRQQLDDHGVSIN
jgi:hypothetical protein